MEFFQNVKTKIGEIGRDLVTIETATYVRDIGNSPKHLLYTKQQTDADTINYVSENAESQFEPDIYNLHKKIGRASQEARLGLAQFIIETLTNK